MEEWQTRTAALIGESALDKLSKARVAVIGIGGVGGHVAEALARCGVGELMLMDADRFSESNLNRQIFATRDTLGEFKTEAAKARLLNINPKLCVRAVNEFFTAESKEDFSGYDYVVDAIDTVSSKIEIVRRCKTSGTPVISSMGSGNKLDPTRFKVADIYQTRVCPLARVMRKLCKDNGIDSLKVVYSEEEPIVRERVPASIAFVPSACGMAIASAVIRDLLSV